MNLEEVLKSKGYNIDDKKLMQPYQEMWLKWYSGNIPEFQNYTIYNGNKQIQCKRKTLNIGKKVCEDFANLLMNERVQLNIGNEQTQKIINKILDYNDFYKLANEAIEKSFALGQGALVLSLGDLLYNQTTNEVSTEEAKLKIDFATADKIFPLSFENGKVTECAFAITKVISNTKILFLSIHKKAENGNYLIQNFAYKVDKTDNLIDITEKMTDTIKEIDTQDNKAWFSIIEPRITNNILINSPISISVFANSIDVIKGIDIAFDSLINEFMLGKKRIFVEGDLLQPDTSTGELKFVFDTNDVVFHCLPGEDGKGSKIQESDLSLRVDEHEKGIQIILNLLSSKLGLGEQRYHFNKGSVVTATQVISENSEMYRTIKKHELGLENSLVDLLSAICSISRIFLGLGVEQEPEISINFDDSIIEDKSEQKRQAQLEYNLDLIDKVQYFKETRNLTTEQALKFIEEMELRKPKEILEEEIIEE